MEPLSKRFLSLYRQIMKTHNKVLPFDMRVIGNLYVRYNNLYYFIREEFKRHKTADPEFKKLFLDEWDKYLIDIKTSNGNFGKDIPHEDKMKLNDLQKEQLRKLKRETVNAFNNKKTE